MFFPNPAGLRSMEPQQLRIQLIQLIALLFPFLAMVLRMTIAEVEELEPAHQRAPVQDIVLIGGGFSMIFLIGAAILMVNTMIRSTGYGLETPFGLALAFVVISLLMFGIITLIFLRSVLVSNIDER